MATDNLDMKITCKLAVDGPIFTRFAGGFMWWLPTVQAGKIEVIPYYNSKWLPMAFLDF
jgi:hypothetical protein